MKPELVKLLVCPSCRVGLRLVAERSGANEIESGTLICSDCQTHYPIVDCVPRFVTSQNYATSFGFQWNRFRSTQLDSTSGKPITRERFYRQTGWTASAMDRKWTLDVGCGAGRFAEVALAAGARVVAVDYSSAVDACWSNLRSHPNLDVIQADVYRLPFRRPAFDFVYCFGVLQHTPDVRRAFLSLAGELRPGGRLAVDLYPRRLLNVVWPKYWLRPVTRRLPTTRLFPLVVRMVDMLWPVSLAVGRLPRVGRKLRHALPIVNYEGILPLSSHQLKDWAVLDTFDMLAPAHDHPQSAPTVRRWFEEAGMTDINVFRQGLIVGRGSQPVGVAAGESQ